MNEKFSEYNGYKRVDFEFEGKECILVFPKENKKNGKWLLKTEYFSAFQDFEFEMLARGYHLAYIANQTRWMVPEDVDRKAKFAKFLAEKYGLCEKCVPVGMSCGGLHAIYFASKYPEHVAAAYLDAPVTNLLSCPGHVGRQSENASLLSQEFIDATGLTLTDLINYRNHPIDVAPNMAKNKIPVIIVSGDADTVVPFNENGKFFVDLYEREGAPIEVVIKPGGDHHPHGLTDNTPIVNFVEKWYK